MIDTARRFIPFALVGAAGAVVDIGTLQALIGLGVSPFVARVVSIALAMACTFALNRRFTFERSGRSIADEGARYLAVAISAAGVNYGVFAAILLAAPALWPPTAVVFAVAVSMMVSFFGYRFFAFAKTRAANG